MVRLTITQQGESNSSLSLDEHPLTSADLIHLQNYLPPSLIEQLQTDLTSPPKRLLSHCITHLTGLLEATTTHFPTSLVKQIKSNPQPGLANGQFVEGTLLFADISGFTAMSERLSQSGREGAEEVTAVVNRYFEVMLDILRDHDGQLIRFGGDALLGLFEERPFSPPLIESATRAVQAAVSMQAAMTQFTYTHTSQGTFPLRMSVGVHYGRFFTAQLGNTHNMEFALFGHDVNAAATTEPIANAGQVVISRKALEAIDPTILFFASPVPKRDDYYIVNSISPPVKRPRLSPFDTHYPLPPTVAMLRRTTTLLDVFTPFLPAGLLTRLNNNFNASSLKGENRLAANLFANIDGLGEIADRLGPGREVEIVTAVNQYFLAMSAACERYGGVINKIDLYDHGDKLLITFGAPTAHEDDAERAIQTALAMQRALVTLNETLPDQLGLPDLFLRQRIGISYGTVFAGFVGTSWRHEYTVMGDEVNLAARLMSVAESNQIIVSQNVWRNAKAMADLTLRGEMRLKGKKNPVPIYEATGLKAVHEQARGLHGMQSPIVGRQTEQAQLKTIMTGLQSGSGQIVSIIGEAGLGKSRLVKDAIPTQFRQFKFRCLSYTESVSYLPFQELFRQMVNLTVNEDDEMALPLLKAALAKWLTLAEAEANLPYIANFLNVPLPDGLQAKIKYLDGEALQRRTFVALRSLITAQAAAAPIVLLLDDIHWLDHASLDLLAYLLPLVETGAVAFMLLFRPMLGNGVAAKGIGAICEQAASTIASQYTEIVLNGLERADSQQLLFNLVSCDEWPSGTADLILDRAEGNPLYLEEVLRSLINDGLLVWDENGRWQFSDQITSINVPDTLEGVLLARLDRLEELSRWTVQVASVVGRSFPYDVLTHLMSSTEETPLQINLTQLQQVEIIRELQRHPEMVYAFMHTLMQEVSYGSLAASSRREHHRLIAAYLEDSRSAGWGNIESLPPLIAHHAYAGQDWQRALRYQLLAGEQAQQLYANHEALDHFNKALHCATQMPNSTEKVQLTIHLALSQLAISTGQYEEAITHLTRADELAQMVGDLVAYTAVCRWQVRLYELRGEYEHAFTWVEKGIQNGSQSETAEYAQILLLAGLINIRQGNNETALEQCLTVLDIAQKLGEVTVLARAHNLLGITYLRSNSNVAIANFQKAFQLYERAGDLHGQATSHNLIANACFNLGRWQEADAHYREAHGTFAQIGDVYNQAIADNNLGGIAKNRGQIDAALYFYQEGLRLAEQIGGSSWMVGVFHMNLGATYVRQGDADTAVTHLKTSEHYFDQAQSRDFLPEMKRHLAAAFLLNGSAVQAEVTATEALNSARALKMTNEVGCSLCLLGQINFMQSHFEEAEAFLTHGVETLINVADEYELARGRYWLAALLATKGNMVKANKLLNEAGTIFRQLEAMLDVTAVIQLQNKLNINQTI
jgi:class 3 adenylate cyclase/tetratricopeptide (TPR) repeat protein/ABC-type cobalamin transport system ATPase subunit